MTHSTSSIGKVSVILPTYNEVGNIVKLCDALHRVITFDHEIIVVDDNSPDGTSQAVRKAIETGREQWLRLETRTKDRGLRKSIARGIELARGDVCLWMDCDFSMPAETVPSLLQKISEGYDIAVGSRFTAGGSHKKGVTMGSTKESWIVIVLSRFLNIFLHIALTPRFHDWTSGFIAVRTQVVEKIGLRGDYGEYFMDFMERAILLQYRFIEVPYVNVPRKSGETKTAPNLSSLFRRGSKYLWMVARLEGVRLKKLFGLRIA